MQGSRITTCKLRGASRRTGGVAGKGRVPVRGDACSGSSLAEEADSGRRQVRGCHMHPRIGLEHWQQRGAAAASYLQDVVLGSVLLQ